MSIWTDKNGRRHAAVMVGGKRLHRRLPVGATSGDAKRVEAGLRSAVTAQRATPGDPLLIDIMGLYMTHADTLRWPETSKLCARRIAPWLEGKHASDARTVAAAITRDMSKAYAPATINRSLAALKKALSLAWERNLVPANHGAAIKSLPPNNKREMFLTIEQVRAVADACPEAARAAVWIALLTGARRGEVLKIRAEDIGPETITIHAGNTKTRRTRVVPIVDALRPWLKYVPIQYTTYEGLKTAFQRARIAAEMPWVNFHDLRHSCASILIASGASLYEVSTILGHSTVTTTQRYAHLEVSQQAKAMNKAFS